MNPYKLHGICQVIAFAILFPLGALIAIFRNQIGPGWLKWHVIFQLSASLFVLIAASAIVYAVWKSSKKHKSNGDDDSDSDSDEDDDKEHFKEGGKAEDDKAKPEGKRDEHNLMSWHKLIGSVVVLLVLFQLIWAYVGKRMVEWNIWLLVHGVCASLIILGGWTNIYIATKLH